MQLSKEYVAYLAREIVAKLKKGELIETANDGPVIERVHAALLEEISLEDRINDEVRAILEGSQEWDILYRKYYAEEVKKLGI